MTKQKYIFALLFPLLVLLPTLGCGSKSEANQEPAAAQVETATPVPTEAPVEEAEVQIERPPPVSVATEVAATTEPDMKAAEADPPTEIDVEKADEMPVVELELPPRRAVRSTAPALADESAFMGEGITVPFTATTGLDTFTAYRLNFTTSFSGMRQDQPTAGNLDGTMEVTKNPEADRAEARHWRMAMTGDTFGQLAALGTMELYDINGTIYIQNPQDGSWIGVPAMLVDSMLPDDMYTPEDHIDLPDTAALQPGQETISGIVTQRYTFGPADLADEGVNYDNVEGTIWVAVDGHYIVRYEATVSGQYENLAAGGLELMDEGTITMMYELSEVNGDFTIDAPAGAQGIDLGKLLSGMK